MRYDYPHIESLLHKWGSWRNRPLRGDGPSGSAMHTPGAHDDRRSYWQPCQQCYATGADLSAVGSGVRTRAALIELATDPDKEKRKVCPSCKGRKGRREMATLADPAAIPRTGPGGMQVLAEDVPQEFADLEAALDGLDEFNLNQGRGPRARAVIEARYVHFPRSSARQDPEEQHGQKARVAWVNERIAPDRISGGMYGYLLTTTRRRLADVLGLQTKHDLEQQREVG